MQRFTVYRQELSSRGTHTAHQANADDQPQFEGVIWTDGTVTLRWLTACKSTSVWNSFKDMVDVHGHPEYGTVMTFHDNVAHPYWIEKVKAYNLSVLNSIPSDV